MNLYTIFDKVAKDAGPVFAAKNDGVARRNFDNLIKENKINKISEYQLYRVGFYDSENMLVTGENPSLIEVEAENE